MTDLLRGACPFAEQLHQLPVQNIYLFSQLFKRHSILVLCSCIWRPGFCNFGAPVCAGA
jgi:hypothetical protein